MAESLAVRYRPNTWDDVTEQSTATTILRQQIERGEILHAYLFVGSQGVGKTTISRIFANEINKGQGKPIELDAASYNSVDNVRDIRNQAKVQSIDSEYKVYIIDECQALSKDAWQAFLKILEEPPKKTIFIFCTTNPEKIPRTILSRVQRFDFKRISQKGIVDRLLYVIDQEVELVRVYEMEAVQYISRISDGGMRDALTLLDKCLAYSPDLTLENVIQALGTVDYEVFFDLADAIHAKEAGLVIEIIEKIHADGKDLKQFVKDFMSFLLDINKYDILHDFNYLQLPQTDEIKSDLEHADAKWFGTCRELLPTVVKLNADLKWETQPKTQLLATLLLFILE